METAISNDVMLTTVGSNIKRLRLQKKMQQNELAALCKIEKGNMSRIESGKVNITMSTLLSIRSALSVEVVELFT